MMEVGQGRGKRAGKSTAKKELSFLRMVFNTAIDDWDGDDDWGGYFREHQNNPACKALKGLKDNERKRYIKPQEERDLAVKLKESSIKHLADIVVVGCGTGLRLSKIVNLREEHCDFDNKRINIPGHEMKNGEAFSCRMTEEVEATLIKAQREKRERGFGGPYFFLDEDGNPYTRNAVSMAFGRARKQARIKDLRFHDLRHDFASLLINNGATLHQVAHALGQKDLRMAARCSHLFDENKDVLDRIEGKGIATILLQSA